MIKKDKNLIAFIKTNPQAEIIMRRFESASRMRQWINEKKQAMSNELELVVKKEIRGKRAALSMDTDTNKKADEEEKASLEKKLETLKNNVEELTQKAPKVHENAKEALALCNSGHLYSIHTTREPSKALILGVEIACRLLGHKPITGSTYPGDTDGWFNSGNTHLFPSPTKAEKFVKDMQEYKIKDDFDLTRIGEILKDAEFTLEKAKSCNVVMGGVHEWAEALVCDN